MEADGGGVGRAAKEIGLILAAVGAFISVMHELKLIPCWRRFDQDGE